MSGGGGLFGGSSGGGGTTVVESSTQNQIPEWIKREGEALFEQAKPLATRQRTLFGVPTGSGAADPTVLPFLDENGNPVAAAPAGAPAAAGVPAAPAAPAEWGVGALGEFPDFRFNPPANQFGSSAPATGGGGGGASAPADGQTPNPAFGQPTFTEEDFRSSAEQRVAPFSADQNLAFDITRANIGSYAPAYFNSFDATGQSAAPITTEDIGRFMSPFTQNVIDPMRSELERQYNRDRIERNASMARRGSYLGEGRRESIDNFARESRDRVLAENVGQLQYTAFSDALNQANQERNRTLAAGAQFAGLAPLAQNLGFTDASAMQNIGQIQQAQEQEKRSLTYEEFIRDFYYPQEQQNWLQGILQGTPYETSTRTSQGVPVGQGNSFAQGIGALASAGSIASGFGLF